MLSLICGSIKLCVYIQCETQVKLFRGLGGLTGQVVGEGEEKRTRQYAHHIIYFGQNTLKIYNINKCFFKYTGISTDSFPLLGERIIRFMVPSPILSKLAVLQTLEMMLTTPQCLSASAFLWHTLQLQSMCFLDVSSLGNQLPQLIGMRYRHTRLIWDL